MGFVSVIAIGFVIATTPGLLIRGDAAIQASVERPTFFWIATPPLGARDDGSA